MKLLPYAASTGFDLMCHLLLRGTPPFERYFFMPVPRHCMNPDSRSITPVSMHGCSSSLTSLKSASWALHPPALYTICCRPMDFRRTSLLLGCRSPSPPFFSPKPKTNQKQKQAVEWAKQKRWKELEEYCMQDVKLTRAISVRYSTLFCWFCVLQGTDSRSRSGKILLPLSWPRKFEVDAYMSHVFDEEKQIHTELDLSLVPKIILL